MRATWIAEIRRAGREIEHAVRRTELERAHGLAPPALIDPQRNDAVDQIIASRNAVEHRARALARLIRESGARRVARQGCHRFGHVSP